jgi:hypothetical protein
MKQKIGQISHRHQSYPQAELSNMSESFTCKTASYTEYSKTMHIRQVPLIQTGQESNLICKYTHSATCSSQNYEVISLNFIKNVLKVQATDLKNRAYMHNTHFTFLSDKPFTTNAMSFLGCSAVSLGKKFLMFQVTDMPSPSWTASP